jgi:hypothetical protein
MPDGRAGDLDWALLPLIFADLRSQSVKCLAGEGRRRQAGYP